MRYILFPIAVICLCFCSCKKVIDLYPESNLNSATYYSNAAEVNTGLLGTYNSLQKSMYYEWQVTELRSDNTDMGVPGSSNTINRDQSDLDEFIPSTGQPTVYSYWLTTYNTIRNANVILQNLGSVYDAASNTDTLKTIGIPISDSVRKQYIGEALVIRANAYFNLVRLFGGVFLVTTPISADDAKKGNRVTASDIYKLIVTDLSKAITYLPTTKFGQIPDVNIGRINAWAAKGILAKVYLTLNQKSNAIPLLQDVITNSGYGLQGTYANVFSTSNEMNSEIIYAVRYKSGNLGLGSSFGNDFAPLGSGSLVINGSGSGWNYPTNDIDTALAVTDARKAVSMGSYSAVKTLYVKKYLTPVTTTNDGESDWPILRYADILLMMAEAQGFTPASIGYINQTRTRAGLGILTPAVTTVADFEKALSNERRLEFAFENQRFFDLLRFNKTLTTITAEQTIKDHITKEYASHYSQYSPLTPLATLLANITSNKMLLPIPQHEIDTNTQLVIPQNPGY